MTLLGRSQNQAFNQLKRDGIKRHNIHESGLGLQPNYECERSAVGRSADGLTVCGKCSGFFAKKYFHRHKAICRSEGSQQLKPTNIAAVV